MRTRRTPHRSRLLITVISLACLMATPARHSAAAEPARLEIAQPTRIGSQVVADVELYGIFDADLLATLQSGLPVNLVFRWSIWRLERNWSCHLLVTLIFSRRMTQLLRPRQPLVPMII